MTDQLPNQSRDFAAKVDPEANNLGEYPEPVGFDASQSARSEKARCSSETPNRGAFGFGVCPVCAGALFEIRGKLQCRVCHTICETCCEGGRQ